MKRANPGELEVARITPHEKMPHLRVHESRRRVIRRHDGAPDTGAHRHVGERADVATGTELPFGKGCRPHIGLEPDRRTE